VLSVGRQIHCLRNPSDHFCRRSCPTTWNEFLPLSMPDQGVCAVLLLRHGLAVCFKPNPRTQSVGEGLSEIAIPYMRPNKPYRRRGHRRRRARHKSSGPDTSYYRCAELCSRPGRRFQQMDSSEAARRLPEGTRKGRRFLPSLLMPRLPGSPPLPTRSCASAILSRSSTPEGNLSPGPLSGPAVQRSGRDSLGRTNHHRECLIRRAIRKSW
jgi:hypothetical protein